MQTVFFIMRDIKDLILSRLSAHRWPSACQPYAAEAPQKRYFSDSSTHFCYRLSKL
jgi:hypothetical protein